MTTEEWREAPSTEGRYEVSCCGRVRNKRTGRLLAAPPDNYGYRRFSPSLSSGQTDRRVHRLVCEAFNGPPPFAGAVVRHLDGNTLNNDSRNLAWGTYEQNEADKKAHGTVARGSRHGRAKLTEEAVIEIRRAYAAGGATMRELGREYGVNHSLIGLVVHGRIWAHVGAPA